MVRVVETTTGLTRSGLIFVAAITALSVAHHADHVVRGSTGWPFDGGSTPSAPASSSTRSSPSAWSSASPGASGARFWAVLAGGAAVFVTAVHLGPAAGDAVEDIPGSYGSWVAGTLAVAVLIAFVAALVAHAPTRSRRLRHRGG